MMTTTITVVYYNEASLTNNGLGGNRHVGKSKKSSDVFSANLWSSSIT